MKGRKILLAFIISAVTLTSGCANGTPKTRGGKIRAEDNRRKCSCSN